MKASYSSLMQSKFFTPSFNTAIFDGPLRIYFSQIHESFGLKVYFTLQNVLSQYLPQLKEEYKKEHKMILIMIYPTPDTFHFSFEETTKNIESTAHEDNIVFGLNGPIEDQDLDILSQQILTHVEKQMELAL